MNDSLTKDWINKLKEDDPEALKKIFYSFYPDVFRVIMRIVSEHSTAEDLAQEVFVRFWDKRHQLEILGEPGPYLRRMAVNEALGYLRKNKKYSIEDIEDKHDLESSVPGAEELYAHGELQDAINVALEKLPPKCRTVFVLSRFDGLSYKEIGEEMEISIKTVENQMGKALRLMRSFLKQYLPTLIWIFLFFMSK